MSTADASDPPRNLEKQNGPECAHLALTRPINKKAGTRLRKLMVTGGIVLLVIAGLAGSMYLRLQKHKLRAISISCCSQLRQIGLVATVWANDHKGTFPTSFSELQAELWNPRVLVCPSDSSNPMRHMRDWSAFDPKQISYEMLAPGVRQDDEGTVIFSCRFHGHVCYADGHVRYGPDHM